jgi:hypothetical protein
MIIAAKTYTPAASTSDIPYLLSQATSHYKIPG